MPGLSDEYFERLLNQYNLAVDNYDKSQCLAEKRKEEWNESEKEYEDLKK